MKELTGKFALKIQGADQALELTASADQLDAIVEALDDVLSEYEEEAFGMEEKTASPASTR